MRIANPIYDSVFKFLMEHVDFAKEFISRLIGLEILQLEPQPQEVTDVQATTISDTQARVFIYRIDFAAVVKAQDGSQHKVLIELQKAGQSEAVTRFRNYLAKHYAIPAKGASGAQALPIIAIYILGFYLDKELPKVIKVKRRYLDGITGEPIKEAKPNDFIEKLTHDAVLVQIPLIDGTMQTATDRALLIFNQRYGIGTPAHFLALPDVVETSDDPLLITSLRLLTKAATDEETRKKMDVEDEMAEILANHDAARLRMQEMQQQREAALQQREEALQQREEALQQTVVALQQARESQMRMEEERRQKEEALAQAKTSQNRVDELLERLRALEGSVGSEKA